MTIQEALTAEFSELDRVTPRPLTHEDYAIAAIQFFNNQKLPESSDMRLARHWQSEVNKELEKLREDRERLLSDKGEQMSNYEDLMRASYADQEEIKGLRFAVDHQVLQTKEYKRLYDEYKERYDWAVLDGTDLRQKLEQFEDAFENLDNEYQDLVRICTHIYQYGDKEQMKGAIEEASHIDDWDKFKNHIGYGSPD